MVYSVSSRGDWVWNILLDKYTRPVVHENKYRYFLEKNDTEKAESELSKAIESYYNLGENLLKSKLSLEQADNAFNKVAELSNSDPEWEKYIAYTYYDYEVYNKAEEKLQMLYKKYPRDLELMSYLADLYLKVYEDEEKALPLLEKAYSMRKGVMTPQEEKDTYEYIQVIRERVKNE